MFVCFLSFHQGLPPNDDSLGIPERYELQYNSVGGSGGGGGGGVSVSGEDEASWTTCLERECTGDENGRANVEDCFGFITNLHAATKYVFRVRCRTARGWSCWSKESEKILTLGRF